MKMEIIAQKTISNAKQDEFNQSMRDAGYSKPYQQKVVVLDTPQEAASIYDLFNAFSEPAVLTLRITQTDTE